MFSKSRNGAEVDVVRRVRQPIILLGSPRSGTTLLGRILSYHPDVAYWVEPRPIWMHGNAYQKDDVLGPEHLTARSARYIDKRFHHFTVKSGKTRFAEKTPSNSLRVPFIRAMYPDCKLVNIIRDGRAVVRSVLQIQKRPPNKGLISTRLKQTPVWEWPAYVPMFFRTAWRTKVLKRRSTYWGPKPSGWQEWIGQPPHILAARQWKAIVSKTLADTEALPAEACLDMRFERLIREPEAVITEMMRFLELPTCSEMVDYATGHIEPGRSGKWKAATTTEQESESAQEMEPLLSDLGYAGPEH